MDVLTFSARLVEALAWPVAALVILVALRRPLLELARLLRSVKYGDVELAFARELREIEQEVTPAPTAAPPEVPGGTAPDVGAKPAISIEMAQLAETSPGAAVLSAWQHLSAAAINAIKRAGANLPAAGPGSAQKIEGELLARRIISANQLSLIQRLRHLTTQKQRVSTSMVLDYVVLANGFAEQLNRWKPSAG